MALGLALLAGGGIIFWSIRQDASSSQYKIPGEAVAQENTLDAVHGVHALRFFDENLFQDAVRNAQGKNIIQYKERMKAGVVPHHLLASFQIADFFQGLSFGNIHTVILIGPNHYERGNYKIISSEYEWNTPFGKVEPDRKIIGELERKKIIQIHPEVIEKEHSLGGIIPFLKYYLPEARVVPLALSAKNKEQDMELFAEELKRYAKEEGVVLVASIDFSHYLSSFDAEKRDEETLKAIRNRQYRTITLFNNDYLDSPPSLISLMKAAENLSLHGPEIIHHTNSGSMTGSKFEKTTSHISLYYYQ